MRNSSQLLFLCVVVVGLLAHTSCDAQENFENLEYEEGKGDRLGRDEISLFKNDIEGEETKEVKKRGWKSFKTSVRGAFKSIGGKFKSFGGKLKSFGGKVFGKAKSLGSKSKAFVSGKVKGWGRRAKTFFSNKFGNKKKGSNGEGLPVGKLAVGGVAAGGAAAAVALNGGNPDFIGGEDPLYNGETSFGQQGNNGIFNRRVTALSSSGQGNQGSQTAGADFDDYGEGHGSEKGHGGRGEEQGFDDNGEGQGSRKGHGGRGEEQGFDDNGEGHGSEKGHGGRGEEQGFDDNGEGHGSEEGLGGRGEEQGKVYTLSPPISDHNNNVNKSLKVTSNSNNGPCVQSSESQNLVGNNESCVQILPSEAPPPPSNNRESDDDYYYG